MIRHRESARPCGLSWSTMQWAFTSTAAANWHPVTWLSHAFDDQLFGLNPQAIISTACWFSSECGAAIPAAGLDYKARGPKPFGGGLFALHRSMLSRCVVAERKNVLSTLFFFLAIGLTFGMRRSGLASIPAGGGAVCHGTDGQTDGHYAAFCTAAAGLLALGRVETGRLPTLARSTRLGHAVLEKAPLLCLSMASAVITLRVQKAGWRFEACTIPAGCANRECSRCLWVVLVEDVLARAACPLSAFCNCSSGLAMDSIGAGLVASRRL